MKKNVRAIADSAVPFVLATSNVDDKNVHKFKLVCQSGTGKSVIVSSGIMQQSYWMMRMTV